MASALNTDTHFSQNVVAGLGFKAGVSPNEFAVVDASGNLTTPSVVSSGAIQGTTLTGTADSRLGNAVAGSATSTRKFVKVVTGIVDAAATDLVTVTVPNSAQAATILITLLGSLGAGGAIGAFEASRTANGSVVLARTAGVNVVAAAATLTLAQIANVAGSATLTLAYGVSAITGAVGAVNTFTIQGTLTKSGGASAAHQCVVLVEVINAVGSGVTVA